MKFFFTLAAVFILANCFAQKDTSAFLDGSPLSKYASTDSIEWRQISGQPSFIEHPESITTKVTGLTEGARDYELRIWNADFESRDTTTITVVRATLGIDHDSLILHIRPKIKKLEINYVVRGSQIIVQVKSPRPQKIQCVIYDITGRPLAKTELFVMQGTNYITLEKPRIPGIYILRFQTYLDNLTRKIII